MIPSPMECVGFLKGMLEEWAKSPSEHGKPRYGSTVLHLQAAITYLEQHGSVELAMEKHIREYHG